MAVDRDAIAANVKYLRNVRPIDPEEISDYVESQPHPAVVRQVVRELAPELGLVERDDGTFEPVGEEPLAPRRGPVESFPDSYARVLDDLLVDRFGPAWHRGEAGDTLRTTIRRLKADYYRNREVEYDRDVALGYALYHLPDYYAVAQYVLSDLAAAGLLGRHLRVLDVGAGVGGPALGLADFVPEDALVEYHAVEPSAAADVLEAMLGETGRNFHPTIHRETAEAFDPASVLGGGDGDGGGSDTDGFDLILFANVLSELDDPEGVVRRYLDALAPEGSLVGVAPADRETSIGLRQVERAVGDDPGSPATIYAPTVRLWPGATPDDRGWSFDVQPDLAVPELQRRLDDAADGDPDHTPGEFVNTDVQYSYTVLRRDGRRRIDVSPDAGRYARMADMESHLTNRIDLLAVKLSHDLSEGPDANPVFRIADGSQREDHYAVLTRSDALNRDLQRADYGDLLAFEQVLVLYNDDERAFNLVVDDETVVDRVPA